MKPTDLKVVINNIIFGEDGTPTVANRPHVDLESNVDNIINYLNGNPVSDFEIDSIATTGNNLYYTGGIFRKNNALITIANGSFLTLSNATHYIEIDTTISSVTENTSGFTVGNIPLYIVTVAGASISSIVDKRSFLVSTDAKDTNYVPGGNIAATNVQAAIQELDTEKLGTGALAFDSDRLDGQHGSFYQDAGNLNAGTLPGARFNDTSHGNRGGGSLHSAATDSVDGFMSAADKAKLDTISGLSPTDILNSVKTVDGSGSGLDADLLDGKDSNVLGNAINTVPVRDSNAYLHSTTPNGLANDDNLINRQYFNTHAITGSWTTVSRSYGSVYTNSTNKPIVVSVYAAISEGGYLGLNIGGTTTLYTEGGDSVDDLMAYRSVLAIIPPGVTYQFTLSGTNYGSVFREYA